MGSALAGASLLVYESTAFQAEPPSIIVDAPVAVLGDSVPALMGARMKMRAVLFAGWSILAASPASAQERLIATDTSATDYYHDPARTRAQGGYIEAWFRLDHSRDRTLAERETKMLKVFDCGARTSQTISIVAYAASGRILRNESIRHNQYLMRPIVPDTVGETMLEVACGLR